ncbi:MAG: hypothetical protein R3225_06180 [Halofilum sp. (in: g-proteobacteria)]|nr:hypothetical protein [Halofilum sp. (in: g-proteobacteria)]
MSAVRSKAGNSRYQYFARSFDGALLKDIYCMLLARSSDRQPLGGLFGTVGCPWFTSALVAHDHAFFVAPEYRGSSTAINLLGVFRRWAEQREAAVLNVSQRVGVEMERFERFMRRTGFEPRGMNFSMHLDRSK